MSKTSRLAIGGAFALLSLVGPALADIKLSAVRIAEGDLWVIGQSAEANAAITLDEAYEAQTDKNGRFEMRVVYHPASCIVTLKTASEQRQAVVGNCGQAGPRGEAGLAGKPGPAGPAGPPGPPGRGAEMADARSPEGTSSLPRVDGLAQLPTRNATVIPPARPTADGARASLDTSLLPSEQPARTPGAPGQPPVTPVKPVAVPAAPPPPQPPAAPIVGEWLVEDGAAKINIQPCGSAFCGAVSWSKAGGELGTQILRSMKATGPNRWEGTILDPTSGKIYTSNLSLKAADALRVEGCVVWPLCGGQTWTRAK